MATWMGHLRVAEQLLNKIGNLDPAYFAMGSLAPDSGIPDENRETYEPPTEVTHFKASRSVEGTEIQDLAFYRRYEDKLWPMNPDQRQRSFLLGYFFHLTTDFIWAVHVVRRGSDELPEEFVSDKDLIQKHKYDWYGQDFIYLRDHPKSLFWRVLLSAAYENDYLDFLPSSAIRQQLNFIKEYYQRDDEDIQERYAHNYPYMNTEQMDNVIDAIVEQLEGVYRLIWEEKISLDDVGTSFELLERDG